MKVSEGNKFDSDKLRFDLIPVDALTELAKVYTMGCKKYGENNWRKGLWWGRIFAALMRHLWAFWRGEELDKESGLSHVIHAMWGCATLFNYSHTHPELDDRVKDTKCEISELKTIGNITSGI